MGVLASFLGDPRKAVQILTIHYDSIKINWDIFQTSGLWKCCKCTLSIWPRWRSKWTCQVTLPNLANMLKHYSATHSKRAILELLLLLLSLPPSIPLTATLWWLEISWQFLSSLLLHMIFHFFLCTVGYILKILFPLFFCINYIYLKIYQHSYLNCSLEPGKSSLLFFFFFLAWKFQKPSTSLPIRLWNL